MVSRRVLYQFGEKEKNGEKNFVKGAKYVYALCVFLSLCVIVIYAHSSHLLSDYNACLDFLVVDNQVHIYANTLHMIKKLTEE